MPTDHPAAATLPSATSLIDEAVHRLRQATRGTWGIYYVGTLPFLLALLFFWAAQVRGRLASWSGVVAAGGIALLFLWMKICQAAFAERLGASLRRLPEPPWTRQRLTSLAVVQTALQPSGLFALGISTVPSVLPLSLFWTFSLSLLLTVTFGWIYAFYQGVTILGDGSSPSIRRVCSHSLRHAFQQSKQHHIALAVLSLLAIFAGINLLALAVLLPWLSVLAGNGAFTLGGTHLLNTTLYAAIGALVYLALDPAVKAFYVLRCFYLDARLPAGNLSGAVVSPSVATPG